MARRRRVRLKSTPCAPRRAAPALAYFRGMSEVREELSAAVDAAEPVVGGLAAPNGFPPAAAARIQVTKPERRRRRSTAPGPQRLRDSSRRAGPTPAIERLRSSAPPGCPKRRLWPQPLIDQEGERPQQAPTRRRRRAAKPRCPSATFKYCTSSARAPLVRSTKYGAMKTSSCTR